MNLSTSEVRQIKSYVWRTRLMVWSLKGRKWRRRVSRTILNAYSKYQGRRSTWGNDDE